MSAQSYRTNSQWMPKEFPHHFDAHIYFSDEQFVEAKRLREKISEVFVGESFHIGDLIPVPIGPHPLPMLEVNFSQEAFANFVLWLSRERGNLNVLIHPQSGDDYYDHTQAAIWLGHPVSLKLELFAE